MAAFDKVASGIPEMDRALDHIRLGDNVVWQVSSLQAFCAFAEPLIHQAKADGRRVVYVRFATHQPLVCENMGVKIYNVKLSHRFETFTTRIHKIIEQEGREVLYVFDCLSELQVAWSTDLMMGNFFRLTCPFLFQLDTIAYFPLLRGHHSYQAIARIRETTQLFLDVYGEDKLYVSPLKVWNRYTPTMFLSHSYLSEQGYFRPITDGIEVSEYYGIRNQSQVLCQEQEIDSWDRFFGQAAQQISERGLAEEIRTKMCRIMMTKEECLRKIICEHFDGQDYLMVRQRMIGTGLIGGKACGMLLARKLIDQYLPQATAHMEAHDSYFIGSDVYDTYLIENNCWEICKMWSWEDEKLIEVARKQILRGKFSEDIREKFRRMLDYYGRNPIIVRSSSILEDGYDNAFAGKYESVFCVNAGSAEERLEAFEQAVRQVYASTVSADALEYRRKRNLLEVEEEMAILVQRVSGSYMDNLFFPHAAGVGYSYSAYKITSDMKAEDGILRLVIGLGTKAVDRTEGAYPKLMSLDCPLANAQNNIADRHRYSQQKVDVLNLEKNEMQQVRLNTVIAHFPPGIQKLLLEHDIQAERTFREQGNYRDIYFASFQGLAQKEEFVQVMKQILKVLEKYYEVPVDIEYTINLNSKGEYTINLVQCRPLHVALEGKRVQVPDSSKEDTLVEIQGNAMGVSRKVPLDSLVVVDPYGYYNSPYYKKAGIARGIGAFNEWNKERGEHAVLMVPGRIGTSSPELGVPVTFSEISQFCGIFEIGYSEIGYIPELSFGSHFFQDLVEEDIFYCAVMENSSKIIYQPYLLERMCDDLNGIIPEYGEFQEILKIYKMQKQAVLYYDIEKEKTKIILTNIEKGEKEEIDRENAKL